MYHGYSQLGDTVRECSNRAPHPSSLQVLWFHLKKFYLPRSQVCSAVTSSCWEWCVFINKEAHIVVRGSAINPPRMMRRSPHIHVNTIQPIPIIKHLNRFTNPRIPQILLQINLIVHKTMAFTSPHPELHLVVRVVRACVEDVDITGFVVGANVAIPEVAVDEGGLYDASVGFKRAEEEGNHGGYYAGRDGREGVPGAVFLSVDFDGVLKHLGEE